MDALERYLHAHSSPEPELLAELDRETHRRTVQPRMLSGHLQGRLLELLVRMNHPRAVLEIGTFTGYSALALAAGLDDDATLDTIETDDELQELAQSFFDRSEHGHKIRLHIGSALELAPRLGRRFDLLHAAVAAAHASRHDHQYRFVHIRFLPYLSRSRGRIFIVSLYSILDRKTI